MLDTMMMMTMTTMMITNYPYDNEECLNVGCATGLKDILNFVCKIAAVNLDGHKS
jgi:hypothetical protein